MSSHLTLSLCFGAAVLAGACVSPKDKLDEFSGRVNDANTSEVDGSGALFDVTGEFLMTIEPSFNPEATIRFITTNELTIEGETGTLKKSLQPIKRDECAPEGNGGTPVGDPIVHTDVAVSATGEYSINSMGTEVDSGANPLCTGSDIVADIEIAATIQSADLYCGRIDGQVTSPAVISLDGSTFGAIRIEPGTVGDENLPEPVTKCPDDAPPDAGPVIDAGTPDAGMEPGDDAAPG